MTAASKIAEEMERYMAENEMAGGALLVRKDGRELYRGKWGYSDIANRIPVEYNTIFRLASMSKPVTAAGIMILEERYELGLEDEISKYLPQFKALSVMTKHGPAAAKRGVTVRDLLSHSGGLGMEELSMEAAGLAADYQDKLADRVEKWSKIPADFQPGEKTGYSAVVGFDILGRLIEIVSGRDLQTFFREEIFEPLGIRDITFLLEENQKKRLARIYERKDGRLADVTDAESDLKYEDAMINGYFGGSAGLYGSLEDYDKFVSMLTFEGELDGVRILKPETVRRMHRRGAYKRLESSPGAFWGLGMMVWQQPELSGMTVNPETYGWSGAYGTHFFIDPVNRIQAVFVMNRSDIGGAGSPIARKIEEMVFGQDVMGE